MLICGLQKLSLLDYPEKLAATIFTGGCNYRCPFCHNASLVNRVSECAPIPEAEVLEFLGKRIGKLDGVCITGGEPLLWDDLADFITEVRRLGFLVKLDTNGSLPDKLASLIERGLLDYVAMDIKNTPKKYPLTVGVEGFDPAPVFESARLLMQGAVDYEFRTTLVRQFHTAEDIKEIGQLLSGAKNYFLQNFVDSGDLVGFANASPELPLSGFEKSEIEDFHKILSSYVQNAAMRI
ncbi:MAG: anaerobic ribonucleoside-triphosphate reductase activating protein [Oscillospiraceae bacterium]